MPTYRIEFKRAAKKYLLQLDKKTQVRILKAIQGLAQFPPVGDLKLPESQQSLAYDVLKTMVLHWDPDFTKLTPSEAARLEEAEADPETFSLDEVMREAGMK